MQWFLFAVVTSLFLLSSSQRTPTKSIYFAGGNSIGGKQEVIADVQIPNYIASGIQIAKQVPYVEVLKLIEAFLRLKGELAGRAWTLITDNAHIISALRDTLISKLGTLHGLTLKALIILRKVLEFASTLFSNVNISVGSEGSFFDKTFTFGR